MKSEKGKMNDCQNRDFKYDEKYFDRHFASAFYRRYVALRNKFIHRELKNLIPTGTFLEIGFGDDNLIKLFNTNFEIFGVDISEFAVNNTAHSYNHTHFKVCDISKEKIPFNTRFDVVCAINTVEHLSDPEFGLNNIYNSLRPGGIFITYLPTQSNLFSKIQYHFLYNVEEHIFRPSLKSLRNLLNRTGFHLVKEYAGSAIPVKISNKLLLESLNLYLGLWKKRNQHGSDLTQPIVIK